jgi:hypothetical protein
MNGHTMEVTCRSLSAPLLEAWLQVHGGLRRGWKLPPCGLEEMTSVEKLVEFSLKCFFENCIYR